MKIVGNKYQLIMCLSASFLLVLSNLPRDPEKAKISARRSNVLKYRPMYFSYRGDFVLKPSILPRSKNSFIIYIMSAVREVDQRQKIRETWCNKTVIQRYNTHGFTVQTFFVLGDVTLEKLALQQSVEIEYRKYKDLLSIANLKDHYTNLTLKSLNGLHFINQTFAMDNVAFVFKVDSDNFVNIFKYLDLAWSYVELESPPDFICLYRPPTLVVRLGRYREEWDRFAGDIYPSYCSGPGYLASQAGLRKLLMSSVSTPVLQSEDVMLTGVGLQDKGAIIVHNLTERDVFFDHYYAEKFPMSELYRTFPNRTYYIHELPRKKWDKLYNSLLKFYRLN